MKTKITALSWFIEQAEINNYLSENAHWLISQAKEIEKKQIEDAWDNGEANWLHEQNTEYFEDGKHYYETKFE